MKKKVSKALGFILATSCFLNLMFPTTALDSHNGAEEIPEETIQETEEEEVIAEEEISQTNETEDNTSKIKNGQDLSNISRLTETHIRQKDGDEWVEALQDQESWFLEPALSQIQASLTFEGQEGSHWISEKNLLFQLPVLESFAYELEEEGVLEGDNGEQIGVYRLLSDLPDEQEETVEEEEEEISSNEQTEESDKNSAVWLELLPDDREQFCKDEKFTLTFEMSRQGQGSVSEHLLFGKETALQALHLIILEEGETETPISAVVQTITANPNEEVSFFSLFRASVQAQAELPSLNDYLYSNDENPIQVNIKRWQYFEPLTPVNGVYILPQETKEIQITSSYKLPSGILTQENPEVIYTFPGEIAPIKGTEGPIRNDAGEKIGTYKVEEDGKMVLHYDQKTVEQNMNGSPISGNIIITGVMNKDEISDKDETSIDIGADHTIVVSYKGQTHLAIQKYADQTQMSQDPYRIPYTITASASKGTSDTVSIKDTWSAPLIRAENIKVLDSDGKQLILGEDYQLQSGNNEFEITGLKKLGEGKKYTVKYDGIVDPNQLGATDLKNEAEVHSKDSQGKDLSDKTTATIHFDKKVEVNKTGKELEYGRYEWTVTINPDGKDLKGWKLEDLLDNQEYKGTATLNINNRKEQITFPYTFTESTTGTVTLTYITNKLPALGSSQISNTVKLTKDNQTISPDNPATVPVTPFDPLKKENTGTPVLQEDQTVLMQWTVTVDATDRAILGPWTLSDWSDNGSYFDSALIQQYKTALENALCQANCDASGLTIQAYKEFWSEDPVASINSEDIYKKITVTIPHDIPKGKSIHFTYETKADISNVQGTQYYNNYTKINGAGQKQAVTPYTPPEKEPSLEIKKKDDSGGKAVDGAQTEHYTGDLSDNQLSWLLEASIPANWNGGPIVIEDQVPDGLTFVTEQTTLKLNGQTLKITWNGQNGTALFYEKQVNLKTIVNDSGKIETIQLRLSEEVLEQLTTHKNPSQKTIPVELHLVFKADNGENQSFTNHASIYDETDQSKRAEAEQTQTIKPNQVLLKEAAHPEGNEYEGNVIPYTVTFNPEEKKLNNGEAIVLTDKIGGEKGLYAGPGNYQSMNLVPGSVQVLKPDGTPLGNSLWNYTYEVDTDNWSHYWYTLTFTVPDETAVIIKYEYKVNKSDNANYKFKNSITATLNNRNETASAEADIHFTATVTGNVSGATFIKQDIDDSRIHLSGAEFSIQMYTLEETKTELPVQEPPKYIWKEVKTAVSDKDGHFQLNLEATKDNPDYLEKDVLYRIVETKAPAGYEPPADDGVLFYFYVKKSSDYNGLKKPDGFSGKIQAIHTGDLITLGNKKRPSYHLPASGGSLQAWIMIYGTGGTLMSLPLVHIWQRRRKNHKAS